MELLGIEVTFHGINMSTDTNFIVRFFRGFVKKLSYQKGLFLTKNLPV